MLGLVTVCEDYALLSNGYGLRVDQGCLVGCVARYRVGSHWVGTLGNHWLGRLGGQLLSEVA